MEASAVSDSFLHLFTHSLTHSCSLPRHEPSQASWIPATIIKREQSKVHGPATGLVYDDRRTRHPYTYTVEVSCADLRTIPRRN